MRYLLLVALAAAACSSSSSASAPDVPPGCEQCSGPGYTWDGGALPRFWCCATDAGPAANTCVSTAGKTIANVCR